MPDLYSFASTAVSISTSDRCELLAGLIFRRHDIVSINIDIVVGTASVVAGSLVMRSQGARSAVYSQV